MDRPSSYRVFYDSDCPFCVRQVNWLARLDWAGQFRWVPASSPEGTQLAARLAPGALAAAVHCVRPTNSVCRGARCLRSVALRLPLLAPLALVLWLPGMLPLAEAGYRWVARNRHRWSPSPPPSTGCGCPRPAPAGAVHPPVADGSAAAPRPVVADGQSAHASPPEVSADWPSAATGRAAPSKPAASVCTPKGRRARSATPYLQLPTTGGCTAPVVPDSSGLPNPRGLP